MKGTVFLDGARAVFGYVSPVCYHGREGGLSMGISFSDGKGTGGFHALRRGVVPMLGAVKISFFGIWTMHTWIYWINTHNRFMPEGWEFLGIYGILSLALVAVIVIYRHRRWSLADDAQRWVFAVLGLAATFMIGSRWLNAVWPQGVVLGVFLGGITLAWCYMQWGAFYSKLDIHTAVACIFVAYVFGCLLKILLAAIPLVLSLPIAAALPALSVIQAHAALKADLPHQPAKKYFTAKSIRAFAKIAICVFTFSFVYAVTSHAFERPSTGELAALVGHLMEIGISLTFLWWVFKHNGSFTFPQLWRLVLLFMATALVTICLFGDSLFLRSITGVVVSLIVMFLWLLLADISHHSDLHPYVVFAGGWFAYASGQYLGMVLVVVVGFESMDAISIVVMLFALAIVMAFFLESRDPDTQRIFADMGLREPAPEEFVSIGLRCEMVGKEHGLTSREIEVMQMLCQGRSKAYIAETLFISESTVRGHAQKLYMKMGVHSKRALQESIGL